MGPAKAFTKEKRILKKIYINKHIYKKKKQRTGGETYIPSIYHQTLFPQSQLGIKPWSDRVFFLVSFKAT